MAAWESWDAMAWQQKTRDKDARLCRLDAVFDEPASWNWSEENEIMAYGSDFVVEYHTVERGTYHIDAASTHGATPEAPASAAPATSPGGSTVKKNGTGEVIRHKARVVMKGYVQQPGMDFDEVFAPVACIESVRLLLALAAQVWWRVHHMDVKSAFLNRELLEEVYVRQPPGWRNGVLGRAMLEAGGHQRLVKLCVPRARCLSESIERLVQAQYLVLLTGDGEARRLPDVDLLQ
ncbi:hypothetical protein E2562_013164 [Oryza meyeriana var. granulata]|uniref:Reverse transcriptase Ty1/copia-type domain-containing protein n=1 Tax=Oryza meyeriana var. granulata TaxID=110450 RepID=A0A6G1DIG8_9ORYZ|nr:hypothetical protein E2562_013164 [Oryza meyeriana var. granulata]